MNDEARRKDREAMKAWNKECDRIFKEWRNSPYCLSTSPVFPPAPKPPEDLYATLPYRLVEAIIKA